MWKFNLNGNLSSMFDFGDFFLKNRWRWQSKSIYLNFYYFPGNDFYDFRISFRKLMNNFYNVLVILIWTDIPVHFSSKIPNALNLTTVDRKTASQIPLVFFYIWKILVWWIFSVQMQINNRGNIINYYCVRMY